VPRGVFCAFVAIFIMSRWGDRAGVEMIAFLLILVAGYLILTGYIDATPKNDYHGNQIFPRKDPLQHDAGIVPIETEAVDFKLGHYRAASVPLFARSLALYSQ
jgi:hypothetical protein